MFSSRLRPAHTQAFAGSNHFGARKRRHRRGAAAIEFAIVSPIFFMFTFACIEFARVNMLRNTAEIAATEGARAGVMPGATASDCIAVTDKELTVLGVKGKTITVEPATLTDSVASVRVTVAVPLTLANGYMLTPYFMGKTIKTSIELRKER